MSVVACPHCQASIPHMPDLAGQQITCGQCKQNFEMPMGVGNTPIPTTPAAPVTPSAPLPTAVQVAAAVAPSAPTSNLNIKPGQSNFRKALKQRFEPSDSIFDLFDWKFQKYVTPLIIRLTWKMVVAFFLCGLVYYLVGPEIWAELAAPRPTESLVPETEFRAPEWFFMLVKRFFQILAMILPLLWIRVVLESMIVIFNIASGISEIEQNTSGRIN
mgnify:CR=1 FL=1